MTKKHKKQSASFTNKAFTRLPVTVLDDFRRSCMVNNLTEHDGIIIAMTIFTLETMKGEDSEYTLRQETSKQKKTRAPGAGRKPKPPELKEPVKKEEPEYVGVPDTSEQFRNRSKSFFEKIKGDLGK